MKPEQPDHAAPADAMARKAIAPVICYPASNLPRPDLAPYLAARAGWRKLSEVRVPARAARCFDVPAGHFFRITSVEGPQVGDLNLWNAADLTERFFSGKPVPCMARICRRATGCGQHCPICVRWL